MSLQEPLVPLRDATRAVAALARQRALQRQAPRIVSLELILTERCNLGCTYCWELVKDRGKVMSFETARAAIDFVVEDASRQSKWIAISLMGGEPMEQYELLRRVVLYAREAGARRGKDVAFDMTTNGTLLEEEHLEFLRDNGVRFCLSLDGLAEDHDRHRKTLGGGGSFDRVAAKLRTFKRFQPWQGARMTVTPETAPRVATNVRGLHELGINQFVIGMATHVTWSTEAILSVVQALQETFDWYLEERVDRRSRRLRIGMFEMGDIVRALTEKADGDGVFGCGAGSGRLAVTPAGVYHGCSKLAWGKGGSDTAPLPLGNVDTGLSLPDNRAKLLDHTSAPRPKCAGCELRTSCNGGCHAANHASTGDIYEPPDDFCQLMFGLKQVGEYARRRMQERGVRSLTFGAELPDLERRDVPLEA